MLSAPPASLLDGASLFLDLDGTLLDLIDRPDEVIADQALRNLLLALNDRLEGRVAVISGRSLAQLETILGPVCDAIALSGSHGCEHRWKGVLAHPQRPDSLDAASDAFRAFADAHPGVMVEDKSYGAALHYRRAPDAEAGALALARDLADELALHLQHGKMMVELRVPGGDKGTAIRRLMSRPPMAGTRPVFLGDDVTDEPGFKAARALGGCGVLVGAARETAAEYRLAEPEEVRAWLEAALA